MPDVAGTDYLVLDFGADPTGRADSTAAIKSAIDALGGAHPGPVVLPPGRYQISEPLVLQSPDSAATVPQPVPLLTGLVAPGRIGDADDTSSTTIFCGPNFPVGQYAIQVLGANSSVAPTGGGVRNLAVDCQGRGAGILAHQPRRCVFEHLSIMQAAAPLPNSEQPFGVAPSGAFSVVQSSGTASAYNSFLDINVAYAAADSFNYATNGKDNFLSCYSLDPGQAADGGSGNNYNVSGGSNWFGCGYSGGYVGWNIVPFSPVNVFGSLIEVGTLSAPSGVSCNAVLISAVGSAESNSQVSFDACRLWCNPEAGQGVLGAIVRVAPGGNDNLANVDFSRCTFQARGIESTPTATAFVWIESGVAGAVTVDGGVVSGTPTTAPFVDDAGGVLAVRNVDGYNPATVTTPAVPSPSTAVTNTTGVDVDVYVAGGTAVAVSVNGTATGQAAGTFFLPAGGTIDLGAYTAAPTWVWIGR